MKITVLYTSSRNISGSHRSSRCPSIPGYPGTSVPSFRCLPQTANSVPSPVPPPCRIPAAACGDGCRGCTVESVFPGTDTARRCSNSSSRWSACRRYRGRPAQNGRCSPCWQSRGCADCIWSFPRRTLLIVFNVFQVRQVPHIGQFVQVDDTVFQIFVYEKANHVAADESGPTGN